MYTNDHTKLVSSSPPKNFFGDNSLGRKYSVPRDCFVWILLTTASLTGIRLFQGFLFLLTSAFINFKPLNRILFITCYSFNIYRIWSDILFFILTGQFSSSLSPFLLPSVSSFPSIFLLSRLPNIYRLYYSFICSLTISYVYIVHSVSTPTLTLFLSPSHPCHSPRLPTVPFLHSHPFVS